MRRALATGSVVFILLISAVAGATLTTDLVSLFTGSEKTATEFATALAGYIDTAIGATALIGDVDGPVGATVLDEAAAEAKLDLQDLQGAVTDAQVPDNITVDLATLATTANAGDSATAFFSSGAIEVARGGTGAAPDGDDQVLVSDSASAATWKTLPDADGTGHFIQYDQATNTFSEATAISVFSSNTLTEAGVIWLDIGGSGISCTGGATTICRVDAGATSRVTAAIPCAVSAAGSYCTIFDIPVTTTTGGVFIEADIVIDTDSTAVAPQFRVRSADTGYAGICHWTLWDKATATTTAPAYVSTAIGTAPADTAQTAWPAATPTTVNVRCALSADASPGNVVIEWQLETGTTPTQNVLTGSHYRIVNE